MDSTIGNMPRNQSEEYHIEALVEVQVQWREEK